MCGIFGIIAGTESGASTSQIQESIRSLFLLSESRGKEAAGIAIFSGDQTHVLKDAVPASDFIKLPQYRELFANAFPNGKSSAPVAIFGHSRLVTNGIETSNDNNQPVISGSSVGVHNGIVVNDDLLLKKFPDLQRHSELDSEVLFNLLQHFLSQDQSTETATKNAFQEIEGTASVAVSLGDRDEFLLATNNGSLYTAQHPTKDLIVFASEKFILQQFLDQSQNNLFSNSLSIDQVKPRAGTRISLEPFGAEQFLFQEANGVPPTRDARSHSHHIHDSSITSESMWDNLRRCTKCVLPETFPMISFNEEGVCSFCSNHTPRVYPGKEALLEVLDPLRSKDGSPDCVVSVSGGRDSCYGLHYIVKELGMNPITFTYDWGMVNDLARRNQARVCGKLGIEQILVSADIKAKRRNIRRNIEAWFKRPRLGMIPLFMAGDKHYFYHADKVRKQTGLRPLFFCGTPLEKTNFKTGFCGVNEGGGRLYNMAVSQRLKLGWYYTKEFLLNPSYLNRSLSDTIFAYFASYMMQHNFFLLFHYVPWIEEDIEKTLAEEYDWETASDTKSTWRIGDSTASFYNYIYFTVAGFTENDTFRSNQIREGLIDREKALRLVLRDNQPRFESIQEYCNTAGVDFHEAITVINSIPKLHAAN